MEKLNQKIDILPYVGDKRVQLYKKLGIETIKDLIMYCPRSYINLRQIIQIIDYRPEETIVVRVKIIDKQHPISTNKKGLIIYKLIAQDCSSFITVIFFNEPYTFNKIIVGEEYILVGKINKVIFNRKWSLEMISPMVESAINNTKVISVYPLTNGLTSKIISRNVYDALRIPNLIKEYLPPWILKEAQIIGLEKAIKNIHFPSSMDKIEEAKKRLIFDELFLFSLGLIKIKNNNLKETSYVMKDIILDDFYKGFTFEFTDAQKKAISECIKDIQNLFPMNRLIQGDVGSGKTVVAMANIYLAYKNNFQSAFLVPTEILAKQHFESLTKCLSKFNINVGLLTGSMTAKQKKLIRENIKNGNIDVIVGTHAILQDSVNFKKLGLVITDEQHRFGVQQRAKLINKGENSHKLVMSATPIPRTLSLIIYGDLDISVIDELPLGRRSILTYYIDGSKRERAYEFIKKFIKLGKQGYIICPAIEENEETTLKSVIEYGNRLKNNDFKEYKLEIIHGKTKDKEKIMQDFYDGKIDLLISTTVIEVGIDVTNAVIIMIEDAERFGLSQLHQLRGRVGRGNDQSYCILISENKAAESIKKLKMMCNTQDGFKISEFDLETRGPGDFFGNRQHGLPKFNQSDILKDMSLLKLSQDISLKILDLDPKLESPEYNIIKKMVDSMVNHISM